MHLPSSSHYLHYIVHFPNSCLTINWQHTHTHTHTRETTLTISIDQQYIYRPRPYNFPKLRDLFIMYTCSNNLRTDADLWATQIVACLTGSDFFFCLTMVNSRCRNRISFPLFDLFQLVAENVRPNISIDPWDWIFLCSVQDHTLHLHVCTLKTSMQIDIYIYILSPIASSIIPFWLIAFYFFSFLMFIHYMGWTFGRMEHNTSTTATTTTVQMVAKKWAIIYDQWKMSTFQDVHMQIHVARFATPLSTDTTKNL